MHQGNSMKILLSNGRRAFSVMLTVWVVCFLAQTDTNAQTPDERAHPERVKVSHVSNTINPLFEELIEPRPGGLAQEGMFFWPRGYRQFEPIGIQYGMAFEFEASFQELAKEQLMPILFTWVMGLTNDHRRLPDLSDGPVLLRNPSGQGTDIELSPERNRNEMIARYGLSYVLVADYRRSLARGAPTLDSAGRPWILDPRSIEAYLEDVRLIADHARNDPNVWALSAGDEFLPHTLSQIVWGVRHGMIDDYPEFAEASEIVKTEFGFGRYGFPHLDGSDEDRFRWIATYRWCVSRFIDLQKQVNEILAARAPHLKTISWNNTSGHIPVGMSQWGDLFDIITYQLTVKRRSAVEQFGFLTKLAADQTGTEELWAVPHVEHWVANHSTEQVEELLSQALRNGATGFHLYPVDVLGERYRYMYHGTDMEGAPERWQVVQALNRHLTEQPFTVRQPEADTGIFYSEASYQAFGRHGRSQEVKWAYDLLGPMIQGAVRFFDEIQLEHFPDLLQQFKVVYVPYGPIVDDHAWEALLAYARNGGVIVLGDNDSFSLRSDGTERSHLLLHAVEPDAYDADGLARRDVGEGKFIYMEKNPFHPEVHRDRPWIERVLRLQKSKGALVGSDHWRFRLPRTTITYPELPGDLCLTGNYAEWRRSELLSMNNVSPADGAYRMSRPALDESDRTPGQWIDFQEGRLTGRLRAKQAEASRTVAEAQQWAYRWTTGDPLSITFRLSDAYAVQAIRLYYRGLLPAGYAEYSADGEEWEIAADWPAHDAGRDIPRLELSFSPREAKYLRLRFDAHEGEGELTLAEAEVWGAKAGSD